MLINEHTAISTSKILLVPYSKHHVRRYHQWMQDPVIQEATASELLTLSQEYAMQESWREDADKLTFIICQPLPMPEDQQLPGPSSIKPQTHDGASQMIGDVNLFLSLSERHNTEMDADPDAHLHAGDASASAHSSLLDSNANTAASATVTVTGEVELMIADPSSRRRGYGRAALLLFLHYILSHRSTILAEFLKTHHTSPSPSSSTTVTTVPSPPFSPPTPPSLSLTAKISSTNSASLSLFSSLGFTKTANQPNYFGEHELHLPRNIGSTELEDMMRRWGLDGWRELLYHD